MQLGKSEDGKTLILEQTFDAPLATVWRAFTDAEWFAKWWGPRGWQTTVKELDFRPGGSLLYGMTCQDKNQGDWYGKTSWGKSVYDAINEPQGFAYTDYFTDENGTIDQKMPATKVTMEFHEQDGKTRVVSRGEYESAEALQQVLDMGMEQGVRETWERLAELLKTV